MANRRYVHPGQSQVIGRDRRDYKAMNTATAGISVAGFDTAPRQHAADGSAKEAKKTFKDLRGTFTEEQMKIDRKSTRLNSSHPTTPRMPSSA